MMTRGSSSSGIKFGIVEVFSESATLGDIKQTLVSVIGELGYPGSKEKPDMEEREKELKKLEQELAAELKNVQGEGTKASELADAVGEAQLDASPPALPVINSHKEVVRHPDPRGDVLPHQVIVKVEPVLPEPDFEADDGTGNDEDVEGESEEGKSDSPPEPVETKKMPPWIRRHLEL